MKFKYEETNLYERLTIQKSIKKTMNLTNAELYFVLS